MPDSSAEKRYSEADVRRIMAGFIVSMGVKQERDIQDPLKAVKMVEPFLALQELTLDDVVKAQHEELSASINEFGNAKPIAEVTQA